MLTTIPPTLHSPGGRQTPAPGSPQHTLAAASASLPRRPVSRRLCAAPPAPPAATRRPKRASATRSPGIHRPHRPRAAPPRPCGPPALRSPPRPANASPPSPPAGNAGHAASSTQLAKALLHRALGEATSHDDKGTRDPPACTRRGRREPTSPLRQPLGVGAWAGGRPPARSGYGRARPWGRQGGPRSAVATVRPPTTKGSGWSAARAEGSPGARPGTAVGGALAPRPKTAGGDEGPLGPGGRTESDRGHQKGGDTHHYTNEDGGDRPAARPPSGSRAACPRLPLPSTGRRPPRVPTQPRTKPTASVTAAARHPDRDPDPRGAGPSPARRLLPPTRAFRREKGAREGKRGCDDTVGARRPASGQERRGWGGPARPGPSGSAARAAAEPGASAGRRAPAPSTPTPDARPPACLPACLPGVAPRAARQGRRCSRRVGSQPGERPRAQPAPPRPAPGRAEARSPAAGGKPSSLRRRSDFCPGTAYSPSQPCFHGRPRQLSRQAGTPSSAPAPPARLRSPATARRPSPRLARQGAAACPRPLSAVRSWPGRNLPAARPGRVPSSLPAGQRTPAFLARVRPGKGAPLGRSGSPACPSSPPPAPGPRPRPRRHGARSRGKPLPRPEPSPPWRAPCLSAGSPRARSRSAKGPLLTTTTQSEPDPGSAVGQSAGARLTRLWVLGPERGSKDGMGGGGGGGGGARRRRPPALALPAQTEPGVPSPARSRTPHPGTAGKPARQRDFGSGPGGR
nr:basic proline-rich protein-like [Ovis aries]